MDYKQLLLFATILLTGLSAGLFVGWSISVIPGTKNVPLKSYVDVMQTINRAILNPSFFIVFFGAVIGMLVLCLAQFQTGIDQRFWLMVIASLIYGVGTIGITMFGNVPLNNMLESMDLTSMSLDAMQTLRSDYEGPWNQFHQIRTLAALVSFCLWLYVGLSR